jgi:hypothetical protein
MITNPTRRRERRPRFVVTVHDGGGVVIVGPFSSTHEADHYSADLKRTAQRYDSSEQLHTAVVPLTAPRTWEVLRDAGVIAEQDA